MTKWLPTLAPIAILIATSLSPTIQNLIATESGRHPWLAMLVACIVWIVNHWLTPPNAPAK